jgi:hypothetical protein
MLRPGRSTSRASALPEDTKAKRFPACRFHSPTIVWWMPSSAASCAAVSSPSRASSATFALKSAVYRFRLPVVRVRPSLRRIKLNRLSVQAPSQGAWMDSLAATSAILRPWYRAPAKSLSQGCRDPLPPATVVAP